MAPLFNLQGKLIRPASITLRFSDEAAYRKAAALYSNILGAFGTSASETQAQTGYYYYSFRVGRPSSSPKDIELRLEWRKGDTAELKNSTIIYWQIAPRDLDAIAEELINLGYELLETDETTSVHGNAQRFIAASPEGNLISGHTNPPFPLMKHSQRQRLFGERFTPKTSATAKLLAGLSLGSVLLSAAMLLRSRRR